MKSARYFLISFAVVLVDQITKLFARISIGPLDTIRVLPFLQLVSVQNRGAAFGLFAGFGNTAFIIISVAAIGIVSFLLVKGGEDRFSLALILGGAVGNVIDRILFKHVTDFLDLFVGTFHWPAFNVADSALTVGLCLMLLRSLAPSRRKEQT
ncbi:MAG TPA: signal peptidase II [Thermodesulfovibrionales bacterium]|nr:signal peptidase II [Thermodesulfovibrionales bacterium]